MTYLIADSGATKTDWLYVDGADTTQIQTQGLHPSNIQMMNDSVDLKHQIGSLDPDTIYFFGAGCGNPVSDEIVMRFLQPIFPQARLRIKSDLDGSGKAFFGKGDGVVVVLGTGSISAKIENGNVAQKTASLGFAIGDEGSAADLGRRILKMYFRRTGNPETHHFLEEKLENTEYSEMMNRIYRAGKPNRELASIAGRVLNPPLPAELESLIQDGFTDFINQQLTTLKLTGEEQIICTGKVAKVHEGILIPLFNQLGYKNVEVRYPVIASYRNRIKAGEALFD